MNDKKIVSMELLAQLLNPSTLSLSLDVKDVYSKMNLQSMKMFQLNHDLTLSLQLHAVHSDTVDLAHFLWCCMSDERQELGGFVSVQWAGTSPPGQPHTGTV